MLASALWWCVNEVPLNRVAPKGKGHRARILAAGQSYINVCCIAAAVITAQREPGVPMDEKTIQAPERRCWEDAELLSSVTLDVFRTCKDRTEEGNSLVRIGNAVLGLQNKYSLNGG